MAENSEDRPVLPQELKVVLSVFEEEFKKCLSGSWDAAWQLIDINALCRELFGAGVGREVDSEPSKKGQSRIACWLPQSRIRQEESFRP